MAVPEMEEVLERPVQIVRCNAGHHQFPPHGGPGGGNEGEGIGDVLHDDDVRIVIE